MMPAMAPRGLRILVLIWAAWWLGVFAPGHERGKVKVAGVHPRKCSSCPNESPASEPPPSRAACCAVCYLNARLDQPPVVDLSVAAAGLLDELVPLPAVAPCHGIAYLPVHRGRAPPAALA